jgi:muramoyltetrapeptide carboxypeptidase
MQFPPPLAPGDEVRVLALSRSLGGVMRPGGFSRRDVQFAVARLEALGLRVSFGSCVKECNEHLTATTQHRLQDFHEAVANPSVKAVLAVSGGAGAIQLLDELDYPLIAAHPKILCGYSDIGYLCSAICARAGVATYYGPNFTTFMMRKGAEYMLSMFRDCLFAASPFELRPADTWSDDAWHEDQEQRTFHRNEGFWGLQEGEAEGVITGGSAWCLNTLQGTKYLPPLRNAILFLEQPAAGKATLMGLDSTLRALSFNPDFAEVRGIVLGRCPRSANITRENLAAVIGQIRALRRLPVIANCDFGHTSPIATIPIGGRCELLARDGRVSIRITQHEKASSA